MDGIKLRNQYFKTNFMETKQRIQFSPYRYSELY